MAEYKYPFIADKKMYAAVMFACKYIRETGCFNKAVTYAANKYSVDEDEIAEHIRARQAAGQKAKSKSRKYRWFVVAEKCNCEANAEPSVSLAVFKGLTAETVNRRFVDSDFNYNMRNDYGGCYAPNRWHEVVGNTNGYATESEAMVECERQRKEC